MGTSASYAAPPAWADNKRQAVQTAAAGSNREKAAEALRGFIGGNGGASSFARGGGRTGTGGSARTAARRLGAFIGGVAQDGLSATLSEWGLDDLVGGPAAEILAGIVDRCGSGGETLEDVDARSAMSDLMSERFEDAATPDEVEERLVETADREGLTGLLADFFGLYVYHAFSRSFWGHVSEREGSDRADALMAQVHDFIRSSVNLTTVEADPSGIDWLGREGQRMAADLFEATLRVFGWNGRGEA